MTCWCETCGERFIADDFGDGLGLHGLTPEEDAHLEHDWSNLNWSDDGR